MSLAKFFTYNNAVPIAISVMMLGAGGAFAATDPAAIYSADHQVISIDNTYLANKDLSAYSPQVQITSVTEDTDNYYVAYTFSTIDLSDSVWKNVTKNQTLTVSKGLLGKYRDLGVYVTEQLKENVGAELARLRQTQDIERKNVTQKAVATVYGGLIGKMLDSSTQTLPGYVPVVAEPVEVAAAAGAVQDTSGQSQQGQAPSAGNPTLAIQILGNNPAQIPLNSTYSDLGAIATDQQNDVIRIETYLNGNKTTQVQIDTSATSTWTIRYVALDPHDNSVSVERTVIVYDPAVGPPVPASQVQNGTTPGPTDGTLPASGGSATSTQTAPADTGATTTATTTPTTAPATDTGSGSSTTSTSTPEETVPATDTSVAPIATTTDTTSAQVSTTTSTTTAN